MENQTPVFVKKLLNVVRVIIFMLRKGKKKLMVDLNLMLKRGKIAGKSFIKELLLFNHHSHHGNAASSSDSASEYEFSCSNTPSHHNFLRNHVIPGLHFISGGKKSKSKINKAHFDSIEEEEMEAINSALETMALNDAVGASPLLAGLGFGVRQLRVTDSPFPICSRGDGDSQVDDAAEAFIKRFYRQLGKQPLTDN